MVDQVADLSQPEITTDHGDIRGELAQAFGGLADQIVRGQSDQAFGGQPDQAVRGQSDHAVTWERRVLRGKPHPAFARKSVSACGGHQLVSPKSGEIADVEEDLDIQSEGALDREAYENAMGIAF